MFLARGIWNGVLERLDLNDSYFGDEEHDEICRGGVGVRAA